MVLKRECLRISQGSLFFLIEVQLIYSVSGLQQSDSDTYKYTYIYFFRFFSIIGYHKILNIILCAIQ